MVDDWQTIAYMTSTAAVIVAIGAFIWQVKSNRNERAFSIFLRLLDFYNETITKRRRGWQAIRKSVRANPKTVEEIGDKTNTLNYLLIRTQQTEPLYDIEQNLLEDEIRSLSLLNELCKYALKKEQLALILKIHYSSEIVFYQKSVKDIILIRDKEKKFRLFSIPHFEHLQKFRVEDYFEH